MRMYIYKIEDGVLEKSQILFVHIGVEKLYDQESREKYSKLFFLQKYYYIFIKKNYFRVYTQILIN